MPGVSGPLVDDEGFPRGDIDLYAVRQARNKYVCAQTDHIEVMKKIEQALQQLVSYVPRYPRSSNRQSMTIHDNPLEKMWKKSALHVPSLELHALHASMLDVYRVPQAIAAIHASAKVDVPRERPAAKMEEDLPENDSDNVFLQVKLTTPFVSLHGVCLFCIGLIIRCYIIGSYQTCYSIYQFFWFPGQFLVGLLINGYICCLRLLVLADAQI